MGGNGKEGESRLAERKSSRPCELIADLVAPSGKSCMVRGALLCC